jgi:PAS domain S-box-containing protein
MPTAETARPILPFRGMWLAVQCLLALLALAGVTLAAARLDIDEAYTTTALLYMVIVVALSLNGSFISAAVVSSIAAFSLEYFFNPPLYTLGVQEPHEAIALFAFLTTALVITRLVSKMRSSLQKLQTSIADRKRAEETTQRQAALLDLTHDTVFVRDLNDVITYWNRGAQELYGWTAEEILGVVTHELLHTEFPAPIDEIKDELNRTGRWEGELIHTRRDGSKVIVASRWSLQRDAQRRPVATLETNNDVTARRHAQDALLRSQQELAHIARVTALGELAASIAHEVNQPLTAIVADANAGINWLTRETPDLARVRETLNAIAKDSERAAQVLTRIRDFLSREDHPFQACDLCDVIRNVLPFVQSDFARHGIHVQTAFEARRAWVMGDRIQLEQVLLNLLLNAADASKGVAMDRRGLMVRAGLEKNGPECRALVEVQDAGIGIRATELSTLFDAFYTTKAGGLGMGLPISRSIIERHGGRLWATANPDHGATFHFALPALP